MGRRPSPADWCRRSLVGAALAVLASVLIAGPGVPAAAQTLNDRIAQHSQSKDGEQDRVLVQAQEMIYNRDSNVVEAHRDVQVYYQGRVLQADKVTYDRTNNRVFAEGRVKLTERDGTVSYADRMDLTGDFKEGFVDSLRSDSSEKTHLTAARAERTAGNVTILDRGTYTACPACEDDPSKPPLWQIRAKRIVHNNDEQMIYYEDAFLELAGVPIAYVPFFSVADPTVKRKSGILTPSYALRSGLGFGVTIPVFWAMAPNYDLTVTPTFYTQQGLFLDAEWRHQLLTGSYNIRASGIFQSDPNAFQFPPNGAGNRQFRGSLDSAGQFYINEQWRFGWDVSLMSDRWFQQDYRLPSTTISSNYFREVTSTAYLTGQGDRGYFDLRGYYFQGLSRYDIQAQQPVVAPVFDYNKTIDLNPAKSFGIGGQIEIDANLTHIDRSLAAYQSTGARQVDSAYNLYDVCAIYQRGSCLVRGIGGDYTRATLNVSWKRQIIDPIGEVWTPFAFAHVNGSFLALNDTNSKTYSSSLGTSVISNASQAAFFGANTNSWTGQATPGVGLEYRYPFVMANEWATHVFEPIAQVIVRPNENTSAAQVNEDAQSLVFDDTNLFQWDKYSGYDRFEGGTRLNYGAQYTMSFHTGGYVNMLIGQSFQLAGRNSYATPDAANVGLSSGLDTRASDIVTRVAAAPNGTFTFIAKARFDSLNYNLRRLDLSANANFGPVESSLQYARYEAQPLIGYDKRREGISASLKYKIDQHYFVASNVTFDLTRHLYNSDPTVGGHAGLFSIAGLGFGAGYTDDCTNFTLNYSSIYQDRGTGTPVRNQTIAMQLQLRTLGTTRLQQSLGDIKVTDGVKDQY